MSAMVQEPTGQRRLAEHPTVKRIAERAPTTPDPVLATSLLREIHLDAGADDIGFVAVDGPRGMGKTPKPVTNGFPDEVNTLLVQIGPGPRPRKASD